MGYTYLLMILKIYKAVDEERENEPFRFRLWSIVWNPIEV